MFTTLWNQRQVLRRLPLNASANLLHRQVQQKSSSLHQLFLPSLSSQNIISSTPQQFYSKLNSKDMKKLKKELHMVTINNRVDDIALNTLRPLPGAKQVKKRVGRGQGSGYGTTAGRGQNGQKKRSSVNIPIGFAGGSTQLYKRVPKFGFGNRAFTLRYQAVTLEKLQFFIDTGRIKPEEGTITMRTLIESGLCSNIKYPGVKLVARGFPLFTAKVDIEVPRASKSAIAAIEANKGNIRTIYFGERALRLYTKPEKYGYDVPIVMSMPPPKLFKYYMNPEVRGYLSDEVSINSLKDFVPDNEEDLTRKMGEKLVAEKKTVAKGKKK